MSMLVEAPEPSEVVVSPHWEGSRPRVAVVVSTHRRPQYLADLVDSLARQSLPAGEFEVVLVDNASGDDTWETLKALAPTSGLRMLAARLVSSPGPATGRNVGVAQTRAPLVAFTDDDCLPSPQWLPRLLERLEAGADVVQGETRPDADGGHRSMWDRTMDVRADSGLFETCNIGYRRDVFERVGGFVNPGPALGAGRPFGEDVALGRRALDSGARFEFASGATVFHRWIPGTYREWLVERRRLSRFPGLVRQVPGFEDRLWNRVFLSRTTAVFDLAVASAVAALLARRPLLAVGVAPWVVARWPDARTRPGRHPLIRLGQIALGDAIALCSLVEGSIRHRRVVL